MSRTFLGLACLISFCLIGCTREADKTPSDGKPKKTTESNLRSDSKNWPFKTPIPESYSLITHRKWNGHDFWILQGKKREMQDEKNNLLHVTDTLLIITTKDLPGDKEEPNWSVSTAQWAAEAAGGHELGSTNLEKNIPNWKTDSSTWGLTGFYTLGGFPDRFSPKKDIAIKDQHGREITAVGGLVAKHDSSWVLLGLACLGETEYGYPLRETAEKLRAGLEKELKGQTVPK
jgi:hypothetical protein